MMPRIEETGHAGASTIDPIENAGILRRTASVYFAQFDRRKEAQRHDAPHVQDRGRGEGAFSGSRRSPSSSLACGRAGTRRCSRR